MPIITRRTEVAPKYGRNDDAATQHNNGDRTYQLRGMNKTPADRLGNNPSQLLGKKIAGCDPRGHKIGEIRPKK
jgi:hypothetical protein